MLPSLDPHLQPALVSSAQTASLCLTPFSIMNFLRFQWLGPAQWHNKHLTCSYEFLELQSLKEEQSLIW